MNTFKFNIGQRVKVDMSAKSPDWVWEGVVLNRTNVDECSADYSNNEYEVSGGPGFLGRFDLLLVWEEEMEAL